MICSSTGWDEPQYFITFQDPVYYCTVKAFDRLFNTNWSYEESGVRNEAAQMACNYYYHVIKGLPMSHQV